MSKTRTLKILFLSLLIIGLNNVNTISGYADISVSEAKTAIQDEEIFLLDVRTISEYKEGHIPDAYLIPVTEINDRTAELPVNQSQAIVVYCRSGSRSASASSILDTLNYSDVRNMLGGFIAWDAAGYPTEIGPFNSTITTNTSSITISTTSGTSSLSNSTADMNKSSSTSDNINLSKLHDYLISSVLIVILYHRRLKKI